MPAVGQDLRISNPLIFSYWLLTIRLLGFVTLVTVPLLASVTIVTVLKNPRMSFVSSAYILLSSLL